MNWRNTAATAILLVGLTQMAGDLLHNRTLKGFGAVTAIAPCPRVFCDIDGFEPFAATFTITINGTSCRITPELYCQFEGPYNRRNVYGAAIAAAPLLPESITQNVFNYAFAPSGPLRQALMLPNTEAAIFLTVRSNTRDRDQTWTFRCSP